MKISANDSIKLLLPYLAPKALDSVITSSNTNNNNYYPNYSKQQYNHSLYLSIALLFFGLVVICGIFYILIKQNKGWGPNAVQIVSITLLIVAGLFLITAGYSQQQITPIVGLLGTIAGYLLGKSNKES
jgi:cytochrome bd-type quinol oxidase subunit 2